MARRTLLAAALTLVGCGAAEHQYVTPWLRVATEPRHVIAPHALELGGGKRLEARDEGGWRRLPHDNYSAVAPVGAGVVVEEHAPRRLFIYHADRERPIRIAGADCLSPRFGAAEIACFACVAGPVRRPLHAVTSAECPTIHLRRLDEYGRLFDERNVTSPIVLPEVEGQATSGEWILAEAKRNPDFLFFYGPRRRFRLGELGLMELPFGADPLGREIAAAERAKKILEQVAQRETALPAMHAQLDADERDSTLTKVDEMDNHMRAGLAISFQVERAEPGACFRVNARSSAALESMELLVHRGNFSSTLDPPLASVSGSQAATVTYCVGQAPEELQLSIRAAKGEGFVSARLYKHGYD